MANDISNKPDTYIVEADVISSPYPVLLSRDFIKQNNIAIKSLTYFTNIPSGAALRDFVSQYDNKGTRAAKEKFSYPVCFTTTATGDPHHTTDAEKGATISGEAKEIPKSTFLDMEPDEEFILDRDEATPWDELLHKG